MSSFVGIAFDRPFHSGCQKPVKERNPLWRINSDTKSIWGESNGLFKCEHTVMQIFYTARDGWPTSQNHLSPEFNSASLWLEFGPPEHLFLINFHCEMHFSVTHIPQINWMHRCCCCVAFVFVMTAAGVLVDGVKRRQQPFPDWIGIVRENVGRTDPQTAVKEVLYHNVMHFPKALIQDPDP